MQSSPALPRPAIGPPVEEIARVDPPPVPSDTVAGPAVSAIASSPAVPAAKPLSKRKMRKRAARLPWGTFWTGAGARALVAVATSAMAASVALHHRLWPDRGLWRLGLYFAAPAALGLGGALARVQAYRTWGASRLRSVRDGALLALPLGAFESVLIVVASGETTTRSIFTRAIVFGLLLGLVPGTAASLAVHERIRRARAAAPARA